ncbi:MAG: flavin reductase family protein [Microcystis sp. M_OC_Ca_00000000_S217Cul]|uniref:Flavin reductase family protein n=1 Tax=Microcystis aeruginosa BLCC-F108 TaxID=2755317 RepID=A0A841URM5_MICAE|nr:flavin reductase family protein [Microcystis aeruginosa BLCC-F108]MCA2593392.1 flavin reductase family protein [Microcystis sp. M31BS1]TRT80337.1 MAG: flavin reductase family protein [Microcystis sp. M_OC_Ca_00000000_S217Cul]TRT87021.1 MAG: flavin reductase family protein [Microcystis sp. M_OC_Ca_00000000_C217Col]
MRIADNTSHRLYPLYIHFVLNIRQEGQHIALMKHFLKRFTPGEDRFANIETTKAENGGPILAEALAYLECRVEQRMECGDHWLIYAIAEKGKVLHQGLTAIHHRKSGSYY